MKRPSIFDYLDYRSFLRDMFLFRKEKDSYFSYRFFSGKAGFSSPNFLKLVIDGKRNLGNGSIAKMAKGFGLKKQEQEYFENLVLMNQAENHDEKNRYYQKMISIKGIRPGKAIDKAQYEYFSKWYYPVIRELVIFGDRRHTPVQIARILEPAITAKEAERALKLLTKLGFIQQDDNGQWQQCDRVMTTGPEVKSLIIANFHREMIRLATDAIERFPADQRDITSLTLSVNQNQMEEIKKRIADFRQDMLQLACADQDEDQVIQINIQAFPMTRKH